MRALRRVALGVSMLCWLGLTGCAAQSADERAADERVYEVSAAWIAGQPAVAWYGGHGPHEAVYLRFVGRDGRAGPALQLTDASRDAFEPSLQQIEGDALVAWYEQEPAAGTPPHQVAMLGRFDSSGQRKWLRQLSADGTRGRIPVVRVAGSTIHVAWLEQQGEAPPYLQAAELDARGDFIRSPHELAVAGPATWNLNAAADPQGRFHVVFDSGSGSRAKELRWIIDEGGRIRQITTADDGLNSVFPDIALAGTSYALAWVDSQDGNEEVYLRCGELGADGAPATAPLANDGVTRRITRTVGQSMGAYVAWRAGNIELGWIEVRGARRELWRQRFDRHCSPRAAAVRVAGWGEAGLPSLASSADDMLLAWNGLRGDPAAPRSRLLWTLWPKRPP